METLLSAVVEALPTYGPWLLFVLAVLETCFVTGLVVPSGLATSVATVLALEGVLDLPTVVAAALAGGAVGDSLGYWIGAKMGPSVLEGRGRFARKARRGHAQLASFFDRHPIYSVTVARLVSFVRTLMPMAAGMSGGLTYRRYLPYELVGLVGWAAIYVGIGVLAGESWRVATNIVGTGGALVFLGAGIALWTTMRRRASSAAPAGGSAEEGAGC